MDIEALNLKLSVNRKEVRLLLRSNEIEFKEDDFEDEELLKLIELKKEIREYFQKLGMILDE